MSFDLNKFYTELDNCFAMRDNNLVESFLRNSLDEAKMSDPVNAEPRSEANMAFVVVSNELASFLRGLSRFEESLATYDAAKEELRAHGMEDSKDYATVILNEAGCWRYMQEPQKALALFLQAADILSKAASSEAGVLAGLFNNISLTYLDLKEPEKALAFLNRALDICERTPSMTQELGITWNNLANAYYALNDKEEAFNASNQATRILAAIFDGQDAHYPAALNTRGILYFREGDYVQALEDFEQSMNKTRLVFGENVDFMITCGNCAACCRKLGREEDARKWEEKQDELKAKLMG